jgi:uncharacterized protein (DUF58 family)
MLTSRAWWLLLALLGMLVFGILRSLTPLMLLSLSLLAWLGWEWLLFVLRVHLTLPGLRLERSIGDSAGSVVSLWAGRTFTVRVSLHSDGPLRLPYLHVTDRVPLTVEPVEGVFLTAGELGPEQPLELSYRIHCPAAGQARFEGVRLQLSDLQGFFYHVRFLADPLVLPILPALVGRPSRLGTRKQENALMPPGIHRLHRPGSGSELLDLRDYLPGDPPRTIAWKVSARRDRLITKEFESEVPIRCTLFVDVSSSVCVRGGLPDSVGQGRALDRLIEIAAGVLQASASIRDPAGLCLFDEEHVLAFVRPDRSRQHQTRLLHLLADAATRGPTSVQVPPGHLLALAYSFAQEVYPHLLQSEVNGMPLLLRWLGAFPSQPRGRQSWPSFLHRIKPRLFHAGLWQIPGLISLFNLLLLLDAQMPLQQRMGWLVLSSLLSTVSVVLALAATVFILLFTGPVRRRALWRKQMAAILSVRYELGPGGPGMLLEDDDALALLLQRFLSDHQVPYALPLYDAQGKYLYASPRKIELLAAALLRAVGKGHDNELFILLVDLIELDDHLPPLLRAVQVALGRHHQVILVCPWPAGLALPLSDPSLPHDLAVADLLPAAPLADLWGRLTRQRYHAAYARLQRTFARLGVSVVCAASDAPVPLILDRIERLRMQGRPR